MRDNDGLNACLLAAHQARNHWELVTLYEAAADTVQDADEQCFFLTQAYVFALEQAHPDAGRLRQRLAAQGRV